MVSAFHIVLRQEEGYDAHQTREFDLELNSEFAIGRASKNISKGYLLPAKNNVYIDSPVVSREHAILTANVISGTPQVYITDAKSMHGTHVNGTPLVPHTPKRLFNGDRLQFGVNVNRNESYFVAFQYTFNAELSNAEPFSRGFTVPEAESEEEDVLAQSGRGSQLDPLILDDSDAASENDEYDEHEEEAGLSEDNVDVTLAPLDDEVLEIDTSSLVEEEDVADSNAYDFDDSDAASVDIAPEYNPESPLVQAAQYVDEVVQVQATPVERDQPSLDYSAAMEGAHVLAFDCPRFQTTSPPAWQGVDNHATFPRSMYDSTIGPPLPPRPSQKRQRVWDKPSHEEQACKLGAPSDMPFWAPLGGSAHGICAQPFEFVPALQRAADCVQTPPHTVSSEIAAAASALATCSTRIIGFSNPEIVDEQPPTPTSINSRKRSANSAFNEETEVSVEKKTTELEVEGAVPEAAVPTVEQVAPQPQRPIAQPKSVLRRALNAAKIMVPATTLGAVFTVFALTALPESFFIVA
ncbi:uncharacterized protein M421DRAFT_417889 [Didymella exigua CBS 183.55]|uniref:FHA domain-containing protein n=1 Tax=Didymella exigua CBS 183.55 TaxID=1150837 RepID=A0A6A5RY67_9PLEO|nr:uncharacterized protein M421DRAFT_417889 [Didymella exigua CBS 183.55]KAF1931236.1 hypothetical protein M421DRAFT_417889 [Didymella exigua CBS 183.55]